MKKIFFGAAAALLASTTAYAIDDCTGDKTGWTPVVVGGQTTTTCYHGGSGNVVDCTASGNHIVVTQTTGGYTVLQHPQFGVDGHPQTANQCIKEDSQTQGDCDVSRAMGTGNTSNFQFYCAG